MASKGLGMAFAHARGNLKETIDYFNSDKTLEQPPFSYNHSEVRSTITGLRRLYELIGEVRDYIKSNNRLMRERVAIPWYDSPSH